MVKVEEPYSYLGMIFEGNETREFIQNIIENISKVKSGELEDYSFENQAGFMAYVIAPDPTQEDIPEGGVQILDFFSTNEEGEVQPLYTLPFDEILNLLNEFKTYLEKNGKWLIIEF